jgi:hypothetical protein
VQEEEGEERRRRGEEVQEEAWQVAVPRTIRLSLATALCGLALIPAAADAEVTVSPTSLTFGGQQVGTASPTQPATVTVSCGPTCVGQDAFFPNISAPPPFTQTNNCATMVVLQFEPDESCTINVGFSPTAPGVIPGTLTTGAPGATVSLSGTGIAAPAPAPPASPPAKKCKKKKKGKKGTAAAKGKCKKKRRK